MKLTKLAAGYALGRSALRQVRKLQRQRRAQQRRNAMITSAVSLGAGVFVALLARDLWLRREERPQWPSRKKLERDAKDREARMRAQQESQKPPPEVHLEHNAATELKAPLRELKRG